MAAHAPDDDPCIRRGYRRRGGGAKPAAAVRDPGDGAARPDLLPPPGRLTLSAVITAPPVRPGLREARRPPQSLTSTMQNGCAWLGTGQARSYTRRWAAARSAAVPLAPVWCDGRRRCARRGGARSGQSRSGGERASARYPSTEGLPRASDRLGDPPRNATRLGNSAAHSCRSVGVSPARFRRLSRWRR